jgi:hypothetical protein
MKQLKQKMDKKIEKASSLEKRPPRTFSGSHHVNTSMKKIVSLIM